MRLLVWPAKHPAPLLPSRDALQILSEPCRGGCNDGLREGSSGGVARQIEGGGEEGEVGPRVASASVPSAEMAALRNQ